MARGRSFKFTDADMNRVVKMGSDFNGPALKRFCKKEGISVATWYNWNRRINGTTVQLKSGSKATVIDLADMERRNMDLARILARAVILKREEDRLRKELANLN